MRGHAASSEYALRVTSARVALFIALISSLLAGLAPRPGLVLCVGPDGHLAIEAPAAGTCSGCDDGARDRSDGAATLQSADDCGCIDLALASHGGLVRTSDRTAPAPDAAPASFPPAIPPAFAPRAVRHAALAHIEARPAALLRTVVLLV